MIKLCNLICCIPGKNRYFWNILRCKHRFHRSLICFKHTINKSFAVHITSVFCGKHIFIVIISYLNKQRHFCHIKGEVFSFCHRISDRIIILKFCLICENKIWVKSVFCTDIREWENVICHGWHQLFGKLCHVSLYGSFAVKRTVNRKCFYKHADCIFKSWIISSIINSCKKTVVCVWILGRKNAKHTCK